MNLIKTSLAELVSEADRVRRDKIGDRLELCSIVNAKSGLCSEDCKFCAQSSRHSANISRYPLKKTEEIAEAAKNAKEMGAEKFGIVTSGNRLTAKEVDDVARAISEIKRRVDIDICASLGALDKDSLEKLKETGLSRYHHNIETSPRFYPQVVTTHDFQERVSTLEAAKAAGLQVCSGGIIGLGETWQDRIDMANLLKELDVDSVPINFLIPIEGTPFESMEPISFNDAIRTIATFRIILEDKIIKIAAGREAILRDSQVKGFIAGANGMLIGGYLTIKGDELVKDYQLVEEIKKIWTE